MQQTLRHIAIPNPYAELGIDVDADDSTIRSAFRELAFELHPDRNTRPDAREAFMRVRKAYELVTNPAYKQQREADIIVEQMTNAANEAMRSRTHHAPQATFKRIHIAPEQPILSVFGLAEQKAKLLSLACVAIALCSVMGAGLLGSAVLAALGATVLIGSVFVWMSRNEPSELHVFGSGFSDTRWEEAGQIGWADITWLDTDPGAEIVDLRLTPASADTLSRAGNVPKGILLEYDGDTYYRLKLGAQYKAVVELISARTGLVIPDNACS